MADEDGPTRRLDPFNRPQDVLRREAEDRLQLYNDRFERLQAAHGAALDKRLGGEFEEPQTRASISDELFKSMAVNNLKYEDVGPREIRQASDRVLDRQAWEEAIKNREMWDELRRVTQERDALQARLQKEPIAGSVERFEKILEAVAAQREAQAKAIREQAVAEIRIEQAGRPERLQRQLGRYDPLRSVPPPPPPPAPASPAAPRPLGPDDGGPGAPPAPGLGLDPFAALPALSGVPIARPYVASVQPKVWAQATAPQTEGRTRPSRVEQIVALATKGTPEKGRDHQERQQRMGFENSPGPVTASSLTARANAPAETQLAGTPGTSPGKYSRVEMILSLAAKGRAGSGQDDKEESPSKDAPTKSGPWLGR